MRVLSLALFLAVAATAATAAQPEQQPAKAPEAQKKPLKVVCHLEKPVGSQMLKRRCFTQEELDLERERAERTRIEP